MPAEIRARRVLAVTSWGGACGIANYAQMLQEAIAPLGVTIEPDAALLDASLFNNTHADVLWLNYHAGLHSRWTPVALAEIRTTWPRLPIVITYHDTYRTNTDQVKRLAQIADRFIVHEPVEDIPEAILIRQGIPKPWEPLRYNGRPLAYAQQPILGTAGFDFPWKNFTKLAELTAEIGWAFAVASHNLTRDRRDELRAINPHLITAQENTQPGYEFYTTDYLVAFLAGCTATAWMYECANSGTSGAIRLGLAAMRPLYALRGCRQFGDLLWEPALANIWVDTWTDLETFLMRDDHPPGGYGPAAALYATDSWEKQAVKYRDVFEQALQARRG